MVVDAVEVIGVVGAGVVVGSVVVGSVEVIGSCCVVISLRLRLRAVAPRKGKERNTTVRTYLDRRKRDVVLSSPSLE